MKLSRYLLGTLREAPKEADVVSHRMMIRTGMIRQVASGIYDLMPTGLRVIRKVEQIVREEMNRAGALEVQLPVVQPAELWQESGRWEAYGKELLRFTDRHQRDFVLGPTHEEVICDLVRRDVSSYKQLPLNLYQIHTKFRDEVRPRFGLMRGREFVMKDAYSFHIDQTCLDREYDAMYLAYSRIFERCGLAFRAVEADTGSIGGSDSHEFMVLAQSGEDEILYCDACDYAANVEKAAFQRHDDPIGTAADTAIEEVATPDQRSIDEVSAFLGVEAFHTIKTLAFETDLGPVVACCLGDRALNEAKLKTVLGANWIELAAPEVVEKTYGSPIGFLGPVRLPDHVQLVVDHDVMRVQNGITGANREGFHLKHVTAARDIKPESIADIATARATDGCPRCTGTLASARGIEVGHIFKLGDKYSASMGVSCLDENGKAVTPTMGCYGIGIGRTAAAAIEQNHDDKGVVWPRALAPFEAAVVPLDMRNDALSEQAEVIYDALLARGIDACLDDRKERPGVKLNDSELIGVPVRVVIGKRSFENGVAELSVRADGDTTEIPLDDVVEAVVQRLN